MGKESKTALIVLDKARKIVLLVQVQEKNIGMTLGMTTPMVDSIITIMIGFLVESVDKVAESSVQIILVRMVKLNARTTHAMMVK